MLRGRPKTAWQLSEKQLCQECSAFLMKTVQTVQCVHVLCSTHHRRRIKTEAKAKVVASVWGTELIKFLDALAILPRTILKNRMN